MARYVGKRIVPKHCGYWDNTKSYEMENIVYDRTSGNSYISRKAVPVGTDISQEEYWALCSDFNMQMDLLEKHFTATYAFVAEAVRNGVFECFTTEDGYFGINSDDDLGLGAGSYSDVVDRINAELVETSINDDGYLVFETDERLGLVFGMDDEGNLIVDYREET